MTFSLSKKWENIHFDCNFAFVNGMKEWSFSFPGNMRDFPSSLFQELYLSHELFHVTILLRSYWYYRVAQKKIAMPGLSQFSSINHEEDSTKRLFMEAVGSQYNLHQYNSSTWYDSYFEINECTIRCEDSCDEFI